MSTEQEVKSEESTNKDKEVDVMSKLAELEERASKLESENKELKEFASLTIKEKKEKAAKDKEKIERLAREAMEAKANTKEEAENIAKQWREKAESLEKQIAEDRQREYQRNLQDKALQLAQTKASKDPNRAKVLADILIKNMKLDEDGNIVVTDDKGNVTISPVDELVNRVSENYKFLVDGLDSSGGGMHSSANSRPQQKSFSEMNGDEKAALYKQDPARYSELEQSATAPKQ